MAKNAGDTKGQGAMSRAAMRDVAALSGVSIATVSRVLNGRPDVSPTTRADVMRHIRELGYVSNRGTRARPNGHTGHTGHTGLISLSVPHLRGDYVVEIIAGAAEALEERNAHLVICSARKGVALDAPLRERLLYGATDGALLVLPDELSEELVALYQDGYPLVVIDPVTPIHAEIPVVATTNWAGAKMATEHLIKLGHTHIGVIAGPAGWSGGADRLAGYQAALLAAGLPLTPTLVRQADLTIDGGYEAACHLLSLPHAATAIFALNDSMAIGVLRAAREKGLDVPRELSVIGFDDMEISSIMTPTLTTVRQPLQGLGRAGANVLYQLLSGQELDATRIELSTKLVARESTAPPSGMSFMTY